MMSAPSARSLTAAVNALTTWKLTSASSSARRISRIAAETSSSVSVPRPRTSASVAWSFSASESNIAASEPTAWLRGDGGATPPSPLRSRDVQSSVVQDERRLPRVVLPTGEPQRHLLAGVRRQAVGLLLVAARLVQVAEGAERGQDRARGVQYLHLERVVRPGGCRLGAVDVQPEAERVAAAARRDRDGLCDRVGVASPVAVEPRIPAAAVRRLGSRVVGHSRAHAPRRSGSRLEARIAEELPRAGASRRCRRVDSPRERGASRRLGA